MAGKTSRAATGWANKNGGYMKITVEIDDAKLEEAVYKMVLEEAVASVRKSW